MIMIRTIINPVKKLTEHFKFTRENEEKPESFWEDKGEACWDILECRKGGRNPEKCNAHKCQGVPYWNVKDTHFKGNKGCDIRQCKECDVYKKDGKEKPIVVFGEKLLNRLLRK